MADASIRSDRRHRFDADPPTLWDAMTRTDEYRTWWPWLRRCDGAAFDEGAEWHCEVQPPLPYLVRFRLVLEEVEPGRFVTATITGDITGHAAIDLHGDGHGTVLRLVAVLAPDQALLRTIARVARPVVRYGHDWVLDAGVRQFRQRALPGAASR